MIQSFKFGVGDRVMYEGPNEFIDKKLVYEITIPGESVVEICMAGQAHLKDYKHLQVYTNYLRKLDERQKPATMRMLEDSALLDRMRARHIAVVKALNEVEIRTQILIGQRDGWAQAIALVESLAKVNEIEDIGNPPYPERGSPTRPVTDLTKPMMDWDKKEDEPAVPPANPELVAHPPKKRGRATERAFWNLKAEE